MGPMREGGRPRWPGPRSGAHVSVLSGARGPRGACTGRGWGRRADRHTPNRAGHQSCVTRGICVPCPYLSGGLAAGWAARPPHRTSRRTDQQRSEAGLLLENLSPTHRHTQAQPGSGPGPACLPAGGGGLPRGPPERSRPSGSPSLTRHLSPGSGGNPQVTDAGAGTPGPGQGGRCARGIG